LAFEYQGEPHYVDISIYGQLHRRQTSDQQKADIAKNYGITLIPIPFWWDKEHSSIISTLYSLRPDLSLSHIQGMPIPLLMPEKFKQAIRYYPNVAKEYNDFHDPSGWYDLLVKKLRCSSGL
jgi:hypothetical protein